MSQSLNLVKVLNEGNGRPDTTTVLSFIPSILYDQTVESFEKE